MSDEDVVPNVRGKNPRIDFDANECRPPYEPDDPCLATTAAPVIEVTTAAPIIEVTTASTSLELKLPLQLTLYYVKDQNVLFLICPTNNFDFRIATFASPLVDLERPILEQKSGGKLK